MARSTRAVAAFRVQAAMEKRLERMRVRAKRELLASRPAHWRSEEEHTRAQVSFGPRNYRNPFVVR